MSNENLYDEWQVVWAMLDGHLWWPGVTETKHMNSKTGFTKVNFFGDFTRYLN